MGNSVEKNMNVGVSANVTDFNKAMRTMAQHIGFAQKATRELGDYMASLQELTKNEKLTAEQTAIVMDRLSAAMDKYRQQVDKAVRSQNAWLDGMRRINTTALAIQARDPFAAGMAVMNRQNAARAAAAEERRQLAALSRTGPNLGRQTFFDALDDATAATNAREASREALQREGSDYMSQFHTSQETVRARLAENQRMLDRGAIGIREYLRAGNEISQSSSRLSSAVASARESILTMVGPLVIAYQAWDQLTTSITKAAEMESMLARFSVFLGSPVAAEGMLGEVRDLSRSTPVTFEGGARAATTLLQFGVAANEVMPALRSIAEITGGNQERMEALALAYAQTQAAGRLMGQELLQMVNAGFNPLKQISEETGESLISLKRRMEDGEISSQMVAAAFRAATEEGGRFHGMLERIADTMSGRLAKAQSAMQETQIAFGQSASREIGLLADAYVALTNAVREYQEFIAQFTPQAMMDRASGFAGLKPSEAQETIGRFVQAAEAAKSIEDANKSFIALVDALGKDNVSEEMQQQYEFSLSILEVMQQQRAEQERIAEVFKSAYKTEQRRFLQMQYGQDADAIALMLETLSGDDRAHANQLVSQGAAYQEIYKLISESSKEELDRLLALKAQSDELERQAQEKEDQKKQDDLYEKDYAKRRDELARWQKQQDDARKRSADQFKSDAERIQAKYNPANPLARLMAMQQAGLITQAQFDMERSALFSDSGAAARSVSAPTAVQGGSAEIVTILANLQVQTVSEQQRLADRAFRIQKATADATGKAAEILDEIKDELAPGMAP